jgi:hypothetical protein
MFVGCGAYWNIKVELKLSKSILDTCFIDFVLFGHGGVE